MGKLRDLGRLGGGGEQIGNVGVEDREAMAEETGFRK